MLYPEAGDEDHIFLPAYPSRPTASRIIQHQFNLLMEEMNRLYSLRRTAIFMRIILSHGKVNMFNLAKNAGTSVEQIERFYTNKVPPSRETAKNLQSFKEESRARSHRCHCA